MREVIKSVHLNREVIIEVLLPINYHLNHLTCRLLVLNDGQDASAYQIKEALTDLDSTHKIHPIIAMAVHVGERKQEYGVSNRPDYANRGSKAKKYSDFIENELFPWACQKFRIADGPENHAIAGFSLGALSAFDVAWHLPHIFGIAGLFSGSFWWRSKDLNNGYQASDRIALQLIRSETEKKSLKFWFQTGWLDESADRDSDGLIDSIGDTLDVILALQKLGYEPGLDVEYVEMGSGQHDHKTMGKILPQFLQWIAKT